MPVQFTFLVSFIFLTSCVPAFKEQNEKLVRHEPPSETMPPISTPNGAAFEEIKQKIMQPHCIKCHLDYAHYESVFAKKEEVLDAIITERMPKNAPSLNQELKQLITDWIEKGAPNSDNNDPPSTVPQLESTWKSLSAHIFFPKCTQCHNPEGQASFLDLTTRQKFFEQRQYLLNDFENVEESLLLEVLNDPDDPMPPQWAGFNPLSSEEIAIIKEWVEKGLP